MLIRWLWSVAAFDIKKVTVYFLSSLRSARPFVGSKKQPPIGQRVKCSCTTSGVLKHHFLSVAW